MLSEKAIASFQLTYKQEFGVEISREEAVVMGIKLLRLFHLIYNPVPKKWLNSTGVKNEK